MTVFVWMTGRKATVTAKTKSNNKDEKQIPFGNDKQKSKGDRSFAALRMTNPLFFVCLMDGTLTGFGS